MNKLIKLSLVFMALSFVSCEKEYSPAYCLENLTGEDIVIYTPIREEGITILTDYKVFIFGVSEEIDDYVEAFCGERDYDEPYVTFFYKEKYYKETSLVGNSIFNGSAWRLEASRKQSTHTFEITEEYILSLPEVEI